MVKVCDAIMGSGKTESVISYINAHPEKKFLYVSPYKAEATRIRMSCQKANFVEPSDKLWKYKFSKSTHTLALVEEGRNIASTHMAMTYYTMDTIYSLKEQGYTVIIDEEVNVLQPDEEIRYADVLMAEEAGYIEAFGNGEYRRTDKEYRGGTHDHMFKAMEAKPLICLGKPGSIDVNYWVFPPALFTELDDVIVLTYLFKGSQMDSFFRMFDIQYEYIGIRRTANGGYEFSDKPEYIPEYASRIEDFLLVEQKEKLNAVGKDNFAFSKNWYDKRERDDEDLERLRKNLTNYFRNMNRDYSAEYRMCAMFADGWSKLKGEGYGTSKVVFNTRATNDKRKRRVLAYPVNVFSNVPIVNFYRSKGFPFDDNRAALSVMLQWIWRSAIRDGKPVRIYVPGKRMRDLLTDWMDEVRQGGEAIV